MPRIIRICGCLDKKTMEKITEEKIRNIIKRRLIETKCVSEDVEWLTGEIFNKFLELYNKTPWQKQRPFKYIKDGMYIIEERHRVKHITINDYMTIKHIWFSIIDFPDEENYEETKHFYQFVSEYDFSNNAINIVAPSINGVLKTGTLKSSLTHELRHLFKFTFSDYNFNKLYYSGLNFIKNNNSDINTDINYAIANLVYFFCDDEIYANAQGLYEYLLKLNKVFKNKGKKYDFSEKNIVTAVPVYNTYYNLKILYKNILNGEYDNNAFNQKWFQNIPLTKILDYIKHQIKYCEIKFGKVIQHAKDNTRQLNEGFVRLHFKNDILFGNNINFLI